MKRLYHIMVLLAVLIFGAACGKGDDDHKPSDGDGQDKTTVFLQNVAYTLTVKCDGSISKVSSTVDEEVSSVTPMFTEEDVAKPLVMHVSGDNVSGTLTLKSIDGVFAGTLQAPVDAADTLALTGVVEIAAAGGDNDDRSTVSLGDLIAKCGHKYTAKFNYNSSEPVPLADSKAYFEFVMSPCQRWLQVNNTKYEMSDGGRLWFALDEGSAMVTNFYKIPYDKVKGGNLYSIDRDGMVDLGIRNVLWADRNVGADEVGDAGGYYVWSDALECVSAPLELPTAGDRGVDTDFYRLSNLYYFWGECNGSFGRYFLASGCFDADKDPFVFFPASGVKVAGTVNSYSDYGFYWSCAEISNTEAYLLVLRSWYCSPWGVKEKNFGGMSVRPIRRGNAKAEETEPDDVDPVSLIAFFPYDYPADDVVAWYTYVDDDKQEEWALYLFSDNGYLLTQYIAKNDSRVIYWEGNYTVEGDKDLAYDNFAADFSIKNNVESVQFSDGGGELLGMEFRHETGGVPAPLEYTKNNMDAPYLYFPEGDFLVEDVGAWYKQVDVSDEEFVVLYIFKDGRFVIVNCQHRDEGLLGAKIVAGVYEVAPGSTLDYRNMTVNVSLDETYGNWFSIDFVDGFLSFLSYRMELQDREILEDLLGM